MQLIRTLSHPCKPVQNVAAQINLSNSVQSRLAVKSTTEPNELMLYDDDDDDDELNYVSLTS